MLLAEFEVLAKVNFSYMFILSKLGRGARHEDAALEKKVGAIGYGKRLVNVVIGDDYSYILVLQLGNYFLDIFHSNGIDSCERFVEQDELRLQ